MSEIEKKAEQYAKEQHEDAESYDVSGKAMIARQRRVCTVDYLAGAAAVLELIRERMEQTPEVRCRTRMLALLNSLTENKEDEKATNDQH